MEDESLTTSGELRLEEADALAGRLKLLLAPGAPPLIAVSKEGTEVRPLRGGDVAMLFRTFNHLEVYRQALIRHGIPHRVLRGRGFYGAQEVLDLASLLSLLADSEDTLAFAAVLRSPLVGLSDASLFRRPGPRACPCPPWRRRAPRSSRLFRRGNARGSSASSRRCPCCGASGIGSACGPCSWPRWS
ncbi:3'-5' exonuclease [Cystobacter fuscus]